MSNLEIHIDGASRGNPGPSGIGAVIRKDGKTVKEIGQFIGTATNNVAEYTALIFGLQEALLLKAQTVRVYTDSQLLYRQITGAYNVKHPNMIGLFNQAKHLIGGFTDFSIHHIPRTENKTADRLATQAIKNFLKTIMR